MQTKTGLILNNLLCPVSRSLPNIPTAILITSFAVLKACCMQSMELRRVGHDLVTEQQQGMKQWLESLLLPFSCSSNHLPDNPMFSSVQSRERFLSDAPCWHLEKQMTASLTLRLSRSEMGVVPQGTHPGQTGTLWECGTENTFVAFMASSWLLSSILFFVKSAKLPHFSFTCLWSYPLFQDIRLRSVFINGCCSSNGSWLIPSLSSSFSPPSLSLSFTDS